ETGDLVELELGRSDLRPDDAVKRALLQGGVGVCGPHRHGCTAEGANDPFIARVRADFPPLKPSIAGKRLTENEGGLADRENGQGKDAEILAVVVVQPLPDAGGSQKLRIESLGNGGNAHANAGLRLMV